MDRQIQKYKQRFWLNATLGLSAIFFIGVVGFFVLVPEEKVSLTNLKKLRLGMSKEEVKTLLGGSYQDEFLKGEMMWMTGPFDDRTFQHSWCEPGGLVYCTDHLDDRAFSGPHVENWGSSKLFITIQFDDKGFLARYAGFPAHLDESYGTWRQQVIRKIQYWWEHWKI
jgi:hypothetical protein